MYTGLYGESPFGVGDGLSVATNVMCLGNETALADCVTIFDNAQCVDEFMNTGVDCADRIQRKYIQHDMVK